MGATGLEPSPDSPKKTPERGSGGSNSGNNPALPANTPAGPAAPADPDLARLVAAWPSLPPALRAGIVAMVKAARGSGT